MLATDDLNNLKEIAGEDNVMKKIVDDLKDLSNDSEVISAYEKEKIERYALDVALKEMEEKGKSSGLELGRKQGKKEGKIEGKKEEKIEIAKNLLKENVDLNIISKTTGLSLEELEKLN